MFQHWKISECGKWEQMTIKIMQKHNFTITKFYMCVPGYLWGIVQIGRVHRSCGKIFQSK